MAVSRQGDSWEELGWVAVCSVLRAACGLLYGSSTVAGGAVD